jgi:hypothetical protein
MSLILTSFCEGTGQQNLPSPGATCKKCFDQVLELAPRQETTKQETRDGLYAPSTSTIRAGDEDAIGLGTGFVLPHLGLEGEEQVAYCGDDGV